MRRIWILGACLSEMTFEENQNATPNDGGAIDVEEKRRRFPRQKSSLFLDQRALRGP